MQQRQQTRQRIKRIIMSAASLVAVTAVVIGTSISYAAKPTTAGKSASACATIQGGTIHYGRPTQTTSEIIPIGYDQWGYNYQAHMFNGYVDNSSRPSTVATSGDWLQMKWNDAWLSNQDCVTQTNPDGDVGTPGADGALDRHVGYDTYRGSGAWLTNHASGTYTQPAGWTVNTSTLPVVVEYLGSDYHYNATFVQSGTDLSGSLTDPYVQPSALSGPIVNGSILGSDVEFAFDYGAGSVQGVRTYVGNIDSNGDLVGTWSQTGSQGGGGSFVIAGFATQQEETCAWTDFIKIVAAPSDAVLTNGVWYSAGGVEIGPVVWGQFAIIQEVSSDPCGNGVDLMNYKSELRSGLGNWQSKVE